MIIMFYISNKRDAVGDLYKNLSNAILQKSEIVLVIPSSYDVSEFSNEFKVIIKEDISSQPSRILKLKKTISMILRLKHLKKKYRIEKIYQHFDNLGVSTLLRLLLRKMKFIMWLHDPILHEGSNKMEHLYRRLGYYLYINNMSKIIISYKKVYLLADSNKYICKLKNKFKVLYLPQMTELEFEDIKNDKNIDIKYDFIFYGGIKAYKGLDLLLEVFSDEELKKIKLLIVGRGNEDKKIKIKCNELDNVTFINDYVPNKKLASYIAKSKYVVLPYKSATGTQTIQIANYYGKMVLATKVGCFQEYIKEGKNGFFIENYNYEAIKKAVLSVYKLKLSNYDDSIYNEYKKFDINRTARELFSIISL